MKIEVTGVHFTVQEKLQTYVDKKISSLEKYIPRRSRESAVVEVRFKETHIKDRKEYVCEVTIVLPGEVLEASDSTSNVFAAVDIVEVKLKAQLKKYKETHGSSKISRRLTRRFKRTPETI